MASLKEYYDTDFPYVLNIGAPIEIKHPDRATLEVHARIHYDYDGGAKFISYYIPDTNDAFAVTLALLKDPTQTLSIGEATEVLHGFYNEPTISSKDLVFTKRFFIYSEKPLSSDQIIFLKEFASQNEILMTFRSKKYAKEKSNLEKPLAFISHDSRDKDFARELAIELQKSMCPVWFDEFSLGVGDSLRESIEAGIKDCRRVIVILSPHFLSNPGWTKVEFNSIFTRELIEGQNLILPIWKDVSKQDVFDYSPTMLDRLALRADEGAATLATKLRKSIFKNL